MNDSGDVKLSQTDNGGDINVDAGVIAMSGGLETCAYLALFGGNNDGSNWWGNKGEIAERQYVSKTQTLLRSLPITSGNLLQIEDAILSDLAFFIDLKIASTVTVEVTIPAVNTVSITVRINAEGVESEFNFTENWKVSIEDSIPVNVGPLDIPPPPPAPLTYSEYIISLSPVAYWRLNEPNSTVNAVDSISGYNGSRVGTVTFGVPGLVTVEPDTALSFPGGNTNRINLPNISQLRPSTEITIEVLIEQTGGTGHNVFKNWEGDAINGYGWGITIFPLTGVRFYLATVGGNNADTEGNGWFTASSVITTSGSYLITCTYDGVNRIIYVDGLPVASDSRTGVIQYGGGEVPYIGAHKLNAIISGAGITGIVQHVALWDRVKTPTEILTTNSKRF